MDAFNILLEFDRNILHQLIIFLDSMSIYLQSLEYQ